MRGGVIISKTPRQTGTSYTCHVGHRWNCDSYHVRKGYWCYICSYKADVLIRLVEDFLIDKNLKYEKNYYCHGSEFDFFLPDYNTLIMCNPETLFQYVSDIQSKAEYSRGVEMYQERSKSAMDSGCSLIRLAAGDEDHISDYLMYYIELITSMKQPVYVFYNVSFKDLPV